MFEFIPKLIRLLFGVFVPVLLTTSSVLSAQTYQDRPPNPSAVVSANSPNGASPSVSIVSETDSIQPDSNKPHRPFPRLAADFEPQQALVLSVSDWQPHHSPVLKQLVEKTLGHTQVLILCNDRNQLFMTLDWLADISDQCSHVFFGELPLDTIWLRDFAPLIAQTEAGFQTIDFYYTGQRPKDDRMPHAWAEKTGSQLVEIPWTLQGGNLLCNGQHLALATARIFEDNAITFPNPLPGMDVRAEARKMVIEAISEGCNLKQLVILEPLQNEATKHCDMFASFLDTDKVVVAELDPSRDFENAAILDRNARRLEAVMVNGRPLQVTRVPIPPRHGRSWSALTNLIIANDLVLIPVYDSDPPEIIQTAVGIYERLLPRHVIKTVDISTFKKLQGELHCLSMHLPQFAAMPSTITLCKPASSKKKTNNDPVRRIFPGEPPAR